MTNLGGIYWKTGKYQESEKNLLEALKLAEEIGDPKYLMAVEDNLGNLYDDIGKPALALEHFKITSPLEILSPINKIVKIFFVRK
ncbi:MAG: tetratricopeptide repeat protein [Bacteroidetes bacterium]|nr:tetratricopeptide repeat protein [Bacteroidota bacterium]